jgi:hypothetical protein
MRKGENENSEVGMPKVESGRLGKSGRWEAEKLGRREGNRLEWGMRKREEGLRDE